MRSSPDIGDVFPVLRERVLHVRETESLDSFPLLMGFAVAVVEVSEVALWADYRG